MHDPYSHGASFGAEMAPLPSDSPSTLGNLWMSVQLNTPQWLKETTTIALGVFGGMALFKIFQKRIPVQIG